MKRRDRERLQQLLDAAARPGTADEQAGLAAARDAFRAAQAEPDPAASRDEQPVHRSRRVPVLGSLAAATLTTKLLTGAGVAVAAAGIAVAASHAYRTGPSPGSPRPSPAVSVVPSGTATGGNPSEPATQRVSSSPSATTVPAGSSTPTRPPSATTTSRPTSSAPTSASDPGRSGSADPGPSSRPQALHPVHPVHPVHPPHPPHPGEGHGHAALPSEYARRASTSS